MMALNPHGSDGARRSAMLRQLIDRLGWGIAGASTLTLALILAGVVNAGPLDPTGPPSAPSGVFGAGTPISSLPHTISSPGSYYLTGNLTGVSGQDGITIAANDVTLDLRGFTLAGVPGSVDGIVSQQPTSWRAITIRNGTVRGWGGSGIKAQFMNGGIFESLAAEGNGQWGFLLGPGAQLSNCSATNNGFSGISAVEGVISSCSAISNGDYGFQIATTLLSNCISAHNSEAGISASNTSRIQGCTVYQNTMAGIEASHTDVLDNKVLNNSGTGIEVTSVGSMVARNAVHANSLSGTGYGINVTGTVHRIEGNHVTDSNGASQDVGIRVTGGENVVIGNSAHDNMTNYDLSGAGGSYGPQQSAATATSPFANIEY
jgi:hypothetical protein